jgi:cell wall-associated NlpC family hydrolase
MHDNVKKVNAVIDELKKGFIEKYGYTVFNIKTRESKKDDEIILTGECLTKKQLNLLKRKINTLFDAQKILYDINVFAETRLSTDTIKWGKAKKGIVDITADYTRTKLATQITPKDNFFKITLRNECMSLIILDDMTMGWVDNDDISAYKKVASQDLDDIKRPKKDEMILIELLSPLFDEALEFIGKVKYLRGGKSANGIDCSALVQILFKRAFNITMPRHTIDQMKCGARVPKNEIQTGDLIFARLKGTNIMHVGVAFLGIKRK